MGGNCKGKGNCTDNYTLMVDEPQHLGSDPVTERLSALIQLLEDRRLAAIEFSLLATENMNLKISNLRRDAEEQARRFNGSEYKDTYIALIKNVDDKDHKYLSLIKEAIEYSLTASYIGMQNAVPYIYKKISMYDSEMNIIEDLREVYLHIHHESNKSNFKDLNLNQDGYAELLEYNSKRVLAEINNSLLEVASIYGEDHDSCHSEGASIYSEDLGSCRLEVGKLLQEWCHESRADTVRPDCNNSNFPACRSVGMFGVLDNYSNDRELVTDFMPMND